MDLVLRMYLWWRLCPLYLGCTSVGLYVSCIYSHARWVTVGDSRLCWCLCDVSRALINSLVCWFCQLYLGEMQSLSCAQLYLGEMQSLRAMYSCIWVKCSHWAVQLYLGEMQSLSCAQLYLGEMLSVRAMYSCIWVKCSHWAVQLYLGEMQSLSCAHLYLGEMQSLCCAPVLLTVFDMIALAVDYAKCFALKRKRKKERQKRFLIITWTFSFSEENIVYKYCHC